MSMDSIPSVALGTGTVLLVVMAMEAGYRLGHAIRRRSKGEKESSVSSIEASILGLLAFMLAFTFGIVSDRYQDRKELVRQEANAINAVYLRADFLPEPDRGKTTDLLKAYAKQRLTAVLSRDANQMNPMLADSDRVHLELWRMAVENARRDMNSDVFALYLEALGEMIDVHRLRLAVGLQTRVPTAIWTVFYILIVLSMTGVGYQTAIGGSKRTLAGPILALSFSLVITLIAELDRTRSRFIPVPQDPLQNLLDRMPLGPAPGPDAPARTGNP